MAGSLLSNLPFFVSALAFHGIKISAGRLFTEVTNASHPQKAWVVTIFLFNSEEREREKERVAFLTSGCRELPSFCGGFSFVEGRINFSFQKDA